ncbi:hypothetical protein AFK69_19060 [Xenorhabdus sp. GDc328]|nr:hypothetical protein AAY47_18860 [Xenorhabdus griffiniae]KOP31782.1 hypothetical protein AFK69_19060 [Xenorhabdus sp. GDc328]
MKTSATRKNCAIVIRVVFIPCEKAPNIGRLFFWAKSGNLGKQPLDIEIYLNPNSGDLLTKCYIEKWPKMSEKIVAFTCLR